MKILWNWLLEYCDLPRLPTPQEGAAALTRAGLEAEGLTYLANFTGVVIAEVVARRPHPNAEKLSIVTVKTAEAGVPTEIVCGAPNVPAPGHRVAWAQLGACLPGLPPLAEKTIKGVVSPGMLCSEVELGISDQAAGIIVLAPGEGVLGASAATVLGVDEWLLELNIPANRGDLLSHVGVARELCACFGGQLVLPDSAFSEVADVAAPAVRVAVGALCAVYTARRIRGVRVVPSSRALAQRLRNVGVRPINNVVDVTNYVMFELGQPLHAFDAATLAGTGMEVRAARAGECLVTLDGQRRELVASDLVIADGGAIALAGVMGGQATEVSERTVDLVLESASFAAASVRATARRLGLHSESSHRFERQVDPALAALASARAARLLALSEGVQVGPLVGSPVYASAGSPVTLDLAWLARLAGMEVPRETCVDVLRRLGCTVDVGEAQLEVVAPSFRTDLTRPADLAEEILRHVGYDAIPSRLPALQQAPAAVASDRQDAARVALAAMGMAEAITFGFTSPTKIAALGFATDDVRAQPIALRNPMSVEQSVMRTSLFANLLAAIAHNQNHGVKDLALFEAGHVFWPRRKPANDAREAGLADEPAMVAGVLTGKAPAQTLKQARSWDVFDVKGLVVTLCERLCGRVPEVVPASAAMWHPGVVGALAIDGVEVGVFGEVHPAVRDAFGLSAPVFGFELALDRLPPSAPKQMRAIPRFPGTSRDVSLLMSTAIPASKVETLLAARKHPLMVGVRLAEEFRDAKLPPNTRSMLYTIYYRAAEQTLTDAAVDAAHEELVKVLLSDLPAERR